MAGFISDTVQTLKSLNLREFLLQLATFGTIVSSALIIWKVMMIVTGTESPIVVVLSESMEPAFERGDLLFLVHDETRTYVPGDVVVYKVPEKPIPIVHRILDVRARPDNGTDILTKGDNNPVDDLGIYNEHSDKPVLWISPSQVVGMTRGYCPQIGMLTIVMNDNPWVKFAMIGFLALIVLTSRDI
eukprot:TRINITY_DN5426_c0_g1_i1.p1 TRINITY_DN5426_c0_g1~~TRINITY_DN5426_c0_g1_i1.p1  ORF type:complete len:187 (-),score=39.80 TRINITY_DN5426_c0_g1_i1:356-916(-)